MPTPMGVVSRVEGVIAMQLPTVSSVTMQVEVEKWPLKVPFRITGKVWESLDVLLVSLEKDGCVGYGEAEGVYFRNDDVTSMARQIEPVRSSIERAVSHESLKQLLPAGGARNALDCALWDLRAKLEKQAVWQLAGLTPPRPVLTSFGCGADTPEAMAKVARGYANARAIKLKLTGEPVDADRVRAVRESRPDVWMSVDANQGFSRSFLEKLLPVLMEARVSLIEQPYPIGQEALLDGFQSPIPVAADECALTSDDVTQLVGRFQVVNIKLDKSGGLTESLAMARTAHALGLDTMVGNMIGTSLAMAPGFLVGQLCKVVDLDGPIFLASDRQQRVDYSNGMIYSPETVWGGASG